MKGEYDTKSVAASGYEYGRPGSVMTNLGRGGGYNPHRGLTPMGSYQDLQAQSRAASLYAAPQLPYGGMGDPAMSPFASNPNLHDMRAGSMYDNRSLYQAAPGPGSAYNPFYGQPQLEHRSSAYSLNQQAQAQAQSRPGSQFMNPSNMTHSSRPPTQILPEMDWAPLDMGEAGISDAKLESSIRRICAEADLDTLTKKGVRKQLEQEHGVGLDKRKETINRIIEKVLNGESLCPRPMKIS